MKWFKCCHCKKDLPESCFYKDSSKPSGYLPRCKECFKLYRTKESLRKSEKLIREKYPEKRKAILAKYYKNNKEKHRKKQDEYRKTLAFKINHRKHGVNRRARMRNVFVESVNYYEIYIESNKTCYYCGKTLEFQDAEFDHYIPISKGGLHKKSNIKCSCLPCNRSNGASMPGGVCHQVV